MENPLKEIKQVVLQVAAGQNADVQKAAIEKYFAPNAGFRHPLVTVDPGPNSRDSILGIYQWYRILSPQLDLEVDNVTYNETTQEVFLRIVQTLHIRWSPFLPVPSRLIAHLTLQSSEVNPGLLVIGLQEDFYHPEDVAGFFAPPLISLVHLALKASSLVCNIQARLLTKIGFWAPKGVQGNGALSKRS